MVRTLLGEQFEVFFAEIVSALCINAIFSPVAYHTVFSLSPVRERDSYRELVHGPGGLGAAEADTFPGEPAHHGEHAERLP